MEIDRAERALKHARDRTVDLEFHAMYLPERCGIVTMGCRVMLPATARAMADLLNEAADSADRDRKRRDVEEAQVWAKRDAEGGS